jgi:hypothetical protein
VMTAPLDTALFCSATDSAGMKEACVHDPYLHYLIWSWCFLLRTLDESVLVIDMLSFLQALCTDASPPKMILDAVCRMARRPVFFWHFDQLPARILPRFLCRVKAESVYRLKAVGLNHGNGN